MNNSLWERLIKLVINNSSGSADTVITGNTDLIEDLSYDSISIIKLIVDIEKEFDMNFSEDYLILDKFRCFESLYSAVDECSQRSIFPK